LPKDAKVDRETSLSDGVKSALALPFKVSGSVRGGFVFSAQTERVWSEELLRELHYLGEVIAGALERKKSAFKIDEILRLERLLSEISATYINLSSKDVERTIGRDLVRLSTALGAQKCILYLDGKKWTRYEGKEHFGWYPEEDRELCEGFHEWIQSESRVYETLDSCCQASTGSEYVRLNELNEPSEKAGRMREVFQKFGIRSFLPIPIKMAGLPVGVFILCTVGTPRFWSADLVPRLRLFGEVFVNALMRKQSDMRLDKAFTEIKQLKERLEADYLYLAEEIKLKHSYEDIIGKTNTIKQILVKVEQVAATDTTVLILGETGTGKGVLAETIHGMSKRKDRPLIKVNCAALTPSLIESELFGHEKGAFTGAGTRRVGRFEHAKGTTLFLDEVGELPPELQPKLLRVLHDGEFERVGGSTTIRTDARVIVATNRDLYKEVEEGRFRRDLWYRLSIFPILLPPLRERPEDIPAFLTLFVKKYSDKYGKQFDVIGQRAIEALQRYHWPGNIRELQNVVERAVITSTDRELRIEIPIFAEMRHDTNKTLQEVEREHIIRVLQDTDWTIEGKNGAAFRLKLNPGTLRFRMKKLNITRPHRSAT
jgi:transcriptional regulator with GAF, ATPase, and Fis domain